jgi:hypothetical protein
VTAPRRPAVWSAGLVAALAAAGPAPPCVAQAPLFGPDSALAVTLRADLARLLMEQDTAGGPWHDATLAYAGADGPVTVPLRVQTRGMYRLLHCAFPPLRLRFDRAAAGTPFDGLRRLKLVTHCRDSDEYEQYVLEEYAIYRVLNLLTPLSLSVRLLRVTYEDAAGGDRPVTRYAFVIEQPERLARRLGAALRTQPGAGIAPLSRPHTALVGVFQYFVANTDWSIQGRHNVALLRLRDTTFAVPFDFDMAGVIATPYAGPTADVPIRSVRERYYHGFCQDAADLEPALVRLEGLRDTIARLYRTIPGLTRGSVERSLRYYDEFYRTIADRRRFLREVRRGCIS